jgi:hypothetical protein
MPLLSSTAVPRPIGNLEIPSLVTRTSGETKGLCPLPHRQASLLALPCSLSVLWAKQNCPGPSQKSKDKLHVSSNSPVCFPASLALIHWGIEAVEDSQACVSHLFTYFSPLPQDPASCCQRTGPLLSVGPSPALQDSPAQGDFMCPFS